MEKFANHLFYKFSLLLFFIFLTGCTSVLIPDYIQDKNSYKKKFYADFDPVVQAVSMTLDKKGWKVERQTDPNVFERSEGGVDSSDRQTLFITKVKQVGMFLGTRYAKLNVYVRSASDDMTEVEIRYLTVNSTPIKNFHNYKHDQSVEWFFSYVEEKLEE